MWTIFLAEAALALLIVGGFVWWVLPKKPKQADKANKSDKPDKSSNH